MNIRPDADDNMRLYFEDIRDSNPLPAVKEVELARRIKEGDVDARNTLVKANLRFVVSVAKEYQNRGLTLAELVSAGNVGLITAAERFDEKRGFKFISYAVWWIRQAIQQTLAEQRIVRLPINRLGLLHKISRATRDVEAEHLNDAELERVADELNVTVQEVCDTLLAGRSVVSFDAPASEDGRPLIEWTMDESMEHPDEGLNRLELRKQIQDAIDGLDAREAEILRLYFGLDGEEPMTLDRIGNRFGLTRERIRQLKERALLNLRSPKKTNKGIRAAVGKTQFERITPLQA